MTNSQIINHARNNRLLCMFDLRASRTDTSADHYTVVINGDVHKFHVPVNHQHSEWFQQTADY